MDVLKDTRSRNRRDNASEVARLGQELLTSRRFKMTSESWTVREQVLVAALDMHETGVCESLLKELKEKFPESQRVMRLEGLLLELQGQTKEAAKIYDDMIKANANNMLGMKRKVCLLKSAGRLPEAIKQLGMYLDTFQADAEAWKELATLYVEVGNYKNAAFCMEEVILSNPHSYLSHLSYAECQYSIGGDIHHLLDARKYFCQSLNMKKPPANQRAMWGLAVTTKAIQGYIVQQSDNKKKDTTTVPDEAENAKINSKVLDQICNQKLPPGMDELVQAAAKRLSCS